MFTGFLFVPNHKRRRTHRFPVDQKLIRRDHYDLSDLGLRYSYFGRLSGQPNNDCLIDDNLNRRVHRNALGIGQRGYCTAPCWRCSRSRGAISPRRNFVRLIGRQGRSYADQHRHACAGRDHRQRCVAVGHIYQAIDGVIQNNQKARQNPKALAQLDGYKRSLVSSLSENLQQFGMEKFARDGISPGHYCGHDRKRQRPTIGAAQIIQRHRHHRRRDPTCSCVPTPDALRVKSRVDQNGTFDKKAQPFRDPLAFCSRFQLTDGPDYRTAPTLIS